MGKNRKVKHRGLVNEGKSPEQLRELGEQFLSEGNYDEAQKHFTACLEKEQNAEVMFSLASCLLELDKSEEAKEHLQRACELDPDRQAEKWLSLAELEKGKEALRCYQQGIVILERELQEPEAMEVDDKENNQKNTLRQLSNVYVCVAELYTTDLCDEPEAEDQLQLSIQKALEADPQNAEAYQSKANYHLIKGEFDVAKELVKKSLDLWLPLFEKVIEGVEEPSDQLPSFNARLSGAKLMLELEMFDEAINVLDGLVLEDEDCIDVWYLLGWTNYLQGAEYHSNSKYYLKRALKVAEDFNCDDEEMVSHINELLLELKDVETDDDDDGEDGDWESCDD